MVFSLKPASGADFVGRKDEVDYIVKSLKEPNTKLGYGIIGSKKLGKTSFLKEIEKKLNQEKHTGKNAEKNIVVIYFSLESLIENSQQIFIKKFSKKILEAYKQILNIDFSIEDLYTAPIGILDTLLRGISLSEKTRNCIKLLLTFEREKEKDFAVLIKELFDLPEHLARETKTKCILLLDEFSEIINLKEGCDEKEILLKIKESTNNYQNTILNITVSNKPLINSLLLNPDAVFLNKFLIKELKPFTKDVSRNLLEKNIERKLDDASIDLIYQFTKGVPFYLNFLGRILKRLEKKTVMQIIDEFLEEEASVIFREQLNRLSSKEKMILVCMVKNDLNTPSKLSRELNYSQTNIRRFLSIMEEKEIIVNTERGVFEIEDNLFKAWLKKEVTSN